MWRKLRSERSISDDTKKQYDSKLKVYLNFLNELGQTRGQPLTILPINAEHVKQCFSFLVESKQVKTFSTLKSFLQRWGNTAGSMDAHLLSVLRLKMKTPTLVDFGSAFKKQSPNIFPSQRKHSHQTPCLLSYCVWHRKAQALQTCKCSFFVTFWCSCSLILDKTCRLRLQSTAG